MKYLAAVAVILIIWLAGLLAFADRIEMMTPAADPGRADGIVVLTGASDARINEALRLLAAGRGERLLVSGVNRQVQRRELRRSRPDRTGCSTAASIWASRPRTPSATPRRSPPGPRPRAMTA